MPAPARPDLVTLCLAAVGLLAAACAKQPDSPTPARGVESDVPPMFVDRTEEWGLDMVSSTAFSGRFPLPEIMGSGVAVFDADGDGRLDIYLADAGPEHGGEAPDRLFVGHADGGFRDATKESGLGHPGWSTGVAAGDLDNDGDIDLYVGAWGADVLYINEGGGRFRDATASAGIAGDHVTTSVALFDLDLDGYLDIFVVHYVVPFHDRTCGGAAGGLDYCQPGAHRPVADTVYRNRGDGTFEDVSKRTGVGRVASTGLGVAAADFDDDGDIDIYVANDMRPNHMWINQGDGTFVDDALLLGVAVNGMAASEASMGVDVADSDRDGRLDVFLTHMEGETSTLYRRRADGAFLDASNIAGIATATRSLTGFGTAFVDVDRNGHIDLLVANGAVAHNGRLPDPSNPFARYGQRDQLLLNDGGGVFHDARGASGGLADRTDAGRGLAVGDFDGDGDHDVVITAVGARTRIYENVAATDRSWLTLRVVDPALQRVALGARVEVRSGDGADVRIVGAGWSYMSSSATDVVFGLGSAGTYDSVEIVWPGGERESFPGGPANRVVVIERGGGR